MAATFGVGVTLAAAAAATITTANALGPNKGWQYDSKNGTDTAHINRQRASVSGFGNTQGQEAQNITCTHLDDNSTLQCSLVKGNIQWL